VCSSDLTIAAICIAVVLSLAGCQTAGQLEAIGVQPDDNAILCIKATVDGLYTDSGAEYTRIELPASLDLSSATPELVQAIADIAERIGC
jgi:hypothetical protein